MSGEEGRWEGPHTDAKHWAEVTRLRAQVAGLAAVIEQARAYIEPLAAVGWSGDLGSILDSADTDAALREVRAEALEDAASDIVLAPVAEWRARHGNAGIRENGEAEASAWLERRAAEIREGAKTDG